MLKWMAQVLKPAFNLMICMATPQAISGIMSSSGQIMYYLETLYVDCFSSLEDPRSLAAACRCCACTTVPLKRCPSHLVAYWCLCVSGFAMICQTQVCHAGVPVKDLREHVVMPHCGLHDLLSRLEPDQGQVDVQRAMQRRAAHVLW